MMVEVIPWIGIFVTGIPGAVPLEQLAKLGYALKGIWPLLVSEWRPLNLVVNHALSSGGTRNASWNDIVVADIEQVAVPERTIGTEVSTMISVKTKTLVGHDLYIVNDKMSKIALPYQVLEIVE